MMTDIPSKHVWYIEKSFVAAVKTFLTMDLNQRPSGILLKCREDFETCFEPASLHIVIRSLKPLKLIYLRTKTDYLPRLTCKPLTFTIHILFLRKTATQFVRDHCWYISVRINTRIKIKISV